MAFLSSLQFPFSNVTVTLCYSGSSQSSSVSIRQKEEVSYDIFSIYQSNDLKQSPVELLTGGSI